MSGLDSTMSGEDHKNGVNMWAGGLTLGLGHDSALVFYYLYFYVLNLHIICLLEVSFNILFWCRVPLRTVPEHYCLGSPVL